MTKTTAKEVIYKIEEVKNIMHENIEKAAENCVKLESIDRKAEELMVDAAVFQTTAKELKNKLWWKNMKIWLIFAVAIVVIILIIFAIVYTDNQSFQKSN